MKANCHIDILVEDDAWNVFQAGVLLEQAVLYGLDYMDLADQNHELSVVLTNDQNIKALNRDYRAKDRPTNVLSFPQYDEVVLGDIVISFQTIEREAKEQGKTLEDHFQHMVVHSLLHLLGYDHIEEDDAQDMEELEINILAKLNVKNPYVLE